MAWSFGRCGPFDYESFKQTAYTLGVRDGIGDPPVETAACQATGPGSGALLTTW
jgi:hypothetical protein